MEGQSARVARDGRDRLAVSGGQVDALEPTHAGVEDEQVPVVPARRVRHGQSRGHRLTGGHVEHGAAVVAHLAPPTRFIGGCHHGDEGRGSVSHRQAVEVTAVLRGQLGDERRPPARHEAVAGVEAGQAGEESVDDPQVRLAAVSGSPGDLVALDLAGDGRGAWQPAPVVAASGRNRGGELGVVPQRPDLPLACHRDPVRSDGDTHGPVEPAEGEGQLPISHTDGHELTGLIGRDQQRTPGFLEHARKQGAVVEPDLRTRPSSDAVIDGVVTSVASAPLVVDAVRHTRPQPQRAGRPR